ncbi:hypothetical protein ESA94_11160 [Lacibacter luteus]|uniref:Uncharacterized protein n=1 Tax=Lacibacter luteus TaxID=2508719 RepID=A0A4V1M7E8_9BACT|nr:hypothetical protein [Lacibacter luteus]RXK59622.1 hypothetical protein ESA94_11160 [Lacibacter luteus]
MAKLGKNYTRFKNWNNFCCLAAACLLNLPNSTSQTIDSVKLKASVNNQSDFKYFNSSLPLLPINNAIGKKVQINFGSPFSHWGFICVGEYKLEQKTGIPFRFRLGSLEYVNKLEGKR